ncbi:MAG: hypothetical protein JSW49_10475 [candidate division WOR-3 bacterium]|nr:MAG: hypothetical protein JSW49_10475 [candidate division WOR-3 bacterium]
MRYSLVFFASLATLIHPCFAEMDWQHLVLVESAPDQAMAIDALKTGLYSVQYDATMKVGEFMRTVPDRQNMLADYISRYRMDQYYLTDGTVEYGFYLSLTPAILSLLLPAIEPVQLVVPMLCPTCNQDWPGGKQPPPGLQLQPKAIEESRYTGIIIDCRGMDLNPCLFPIIFDEEEHDVFSVNFTDLDKAVERGILLYADSDSAASSRTGNNPLRIKASAVVGEGKTDVMILSREARRIHGSQNNLTLLRECRVAIVSGQ